MTDKDKIKFEIRYLKKGLKSKRTPPLYEELMNELGFVKKVNNHSGVAVEFFKENYPEYVTEKGECLSPYWDLFSAGVICATFELNNENADLEREISVLLSCKNCPENKGGYICQKEYEDKCLAQKTQYIKELQEEIAELKEILKIVLDEWKENRWILQSEKEIKMIESLLERAEQFLKENK